MGGALLCLVLIPARIDGGWSETLALADAADKFRLLDFPLGLERRHLLYARHQWIRLEPNQLWHRSDGDPAVSDDQR